MSAKQIDRPSIEEPLAALERELIEAYVVSAGHDLRTLLTRDDDDARKLLTAASRFATDKLAEVEARSHYLRTLHGQP